MIDNNDKNKWLAIKGKSQIVRGGAGFEQSTHFSPYFFQALHKRLVTVILFS